MIDYDKLNLQLQEYQKDFELFQRILNPKLIEYYDTNISLWKRYLPLQPFNAKQDKQADWTPHNLRYPEALKGTHGEFIVATIVSGWPNFYVQVGLTKEDELNGRDLLIKKDTWKSWYSIQVKTVEAPTQDAIFDVKRNWLGRDNKMFGFKYYGADRIALVDVDHRHAFIGDFVDFVRICEGNDQMDQTSFDVLTSLIKKGSFYKLEQSETV